MVSIAYETFKEDFEKTLKTIIKQSLQNKANEAEPETDLYKIGNFTLNARLRMLSYKGQKPVKLTPKENKLLKLLITYNT